jgi:hypothetical protein
LQPRHGDELLHHRSLFIATTFLGVVLGMIAWLDRAWIGK